MHVRYGSYNHGNGEVALATQTVVEQNEALGKKWLRRSFTLSGYLIAESTAEMIGYARSLENAYAADGRDLRLIDNSGGSTHLQLLNSECIGGTRVVQRPSFPNLTNAAYVTFLPYTIVIEGLVAVSSAMSYVAFEERLRRSGGGERKGHLEPLTGRPIEQLLKKHTIYHVIQTGSAVGLLGYPTPPSALWPASLMEEPEIEHVTPQRIGSGVDASYVEFGISWAYRFESKTPLLGNPNVWA